MMRPPRFQVITCLCRAHRLVRLDRRRSIVRKSNLLQYGGVCDGCGRGIDLQLEKRPGNDVRGSRGTEAR